jgi:hypothetical protein
LASLQVFSEPEPAEMREVTSETEKEEEEEEEGEEEVDVPQGAGEE